MSDTPLALTYDRGTVVISSGPPEFNYNSLPGVLFDPRTSTHRAQGRHYRAIVEHIIREKLPYTDTARGWENKPTEWKLTTDRVPRDYQNAAVSAWMKTGRRGVVVMPTGTGKTFTAFLCMEIITPTIDLMNQWYAELVDLFGLDVGLVGGGYHEFKPITVTTYDSAYIHLEKWGNKYGLVVFDECHHLPGASYSEAANAGLAPFRLGLTATPERADGGEDRFPELIGPIVYRLDINEVAGEFLAPYEARQVFIDLTPEEEERYRTAREIYRGFVADRGISLSGPNGWQKFIFESSKSAEGMKAMRAYREQKHIERSTSGEYTVVVTSQVLNEGVDVPAAGVGIVLSGSGSTRENVQRLGRILRKHGDKQAVLYELIARGTSEEFVSDRRRQHRAFQ